MKKNEAIRLFVERELSSIPTEWVKIVAEHYDEYPSLGMWGTCFIVNDHFLGERLFENSKELTEDNEDDDEEMQGEHCILDSKKRTTAAFIYEIDGKYIISVNGAGWNFYDGVWNNVYDAAGMQWHDEEE